MAWVEVANRRTGRWKVDGPVGPLKRSRLVDGPDGGEPFCHLEKKNHAKAKIPHWIKGFYYPHLALGRCVETRQ